jgi:transcriptional regulator with XRE-family HTH domain
LWEQGAARFFLTSGQLSRTNTTTPQNINRTGSNNMPNNQLKNINWPLLRSMTENQRTIKDKLTFMAVSTSIPQPTLSRFLNGTNRLSEGNLKLICIWLRRPVEDFQIEREGRVITDRETAKEIAQRFDQLAGLVANERISRSKYRELVMDELELFSSRQYFLEKVKGF